MSGFYYVLAASLILSVTGCKSNNNHGCGRDGFQEVIREANIKVFPTVVYIHTIRGNLESGRDTVNTISGSGVIISPDGEVLTNYHVAEKAVEMRCLLNTGVAYNAKMVGGDKDIDLALLKLDLPAGTPPLTYSRLETENPVSDGDFVMAMGAPWGMNRSVAIGIISCATRYLEGSSQYTLWLQTDAAISPGNSGGPLINTAGHVIGLNTFGIPYGGNMGFALPATTISEVLPLLRRDGRINWGWCGLKLQPLNDFDRNINFNYPNGVMVAGTAPGSLVRKAGILPNDRIVAVNDRLVTVKTSESLPGFERYLGLLPRENPVIFQVLRGGKEVQIPISMREKGKVEGDEVACSRLGFTGKAINRFETPNLYFYQNTGLYVYGVAYPGNASRADLRQGDIILTLGDYKITTSDDLRKAYAELLEKQSRSTRVSMMVLRNGLNKQIVVDFSIDYEKE